MRTNFKKYLIKSNYDRYFSYKYALKNIFLRRFKNNNFFFIKNAHIYLPIYWKQASDFYPTVQYNAYQNEFSWINKKFNNAKYHKLISNIKEKIQKLRFKKTSLFIEKIPFRLYFILNFLYVYNYFFYSLYIDLFYFSKLIKSKKKLLYYYLILSFKKNKLFINLMDSSKKNYISLSTGLFIKFFEKKKSFKKNKTIKLLMAKYFRKLFLITKIKNIILILKKNPVFLMEILNFLNSPIAHKFINPIDNKLIEENETNPTILKFLYFIFAENKDFSKNKKPQRGRIKRKILRKVVFENKIID